MLEILIKEVEGGYIPKNQDGDAGYDVIATAEPRIVGQFIDRPLDSGKLWTNVQFIEYRSSLNICPVPLNFKDGQVLFHTNAQPRSSNSKYNLLQANSIGLIDGSYTGEILFRFKYYFQPENLVVIPEAGINRVYGIIDPLTIYQKGDTIGQLVFATTIKVDKFTVIKQLPETKRGEGGFGSTGK